MLVYGAIVLDVHHIVAVFLGTRLLISCVLVHRHGVPHEQSVGVDMAADAAHPLATVRHRG